VAASLRGTVRELRARVAFLEGELAARDRLIGELQRTIAEQRSQIERLTALVEELQRADKRQAAPFSKGEPKSGPAKPGRKPGARYGRRSGREVPHRVDETYAAACPKQCSCGGAVDSQGTVNLYEMDLPRVAPRVRKFTCGFGYCGRCGRRVQGRHPLQTSQAHEVGRVHVGPVAIAFAARLKMVSGISYGQVAAVMKEVLNFPVHRSTLCRALGRLARKSEPTFQSLIAQTRASPVVYPDETGYRIGGRSAWAWAFVSRSVSLICILWGRGYAEAASILGHAYSGALVPDGWAPYRRFTRATLGTCNAHLLRRCREMLATATRGAVSFPRAVKKLLQDGLDLRDRRDAKQLSPHGVKVALGRLKARLDRLLRGTQMTNPANRRFAKHLRRYRGAIFRYLERSGLEATNWPAEHEMRVVARIRKSCAGNRTERGAKTTSVLLSILRTAAKRNHDILALVAAILRDPVPRAHL
jgi:transposase